MKNKPPVIFIDVSWFAHRAQHTMGELEFDNAATGVVFGFLEQLRTIAFDKRIRSNRFVFCFDSRHSYRRDSFPAYKAKRNDKERTPEELAEIGERRRQVKLLRREILPSIGFPCLYQCGLESDDLIAQGCLQLEDSTGVIITADGDLYQCIRPNVHWYDPFRNIYLDVAALAALKRVSPWDWREVKAMAGCDTDGVPGIPGVGEKTATDYLWKLLNPKHFRYGAIVSKQGQRIIERNLPLVTLPHPATTPVEMPVPERDYNFTAFLEWCEKFGFASYLEGSRMEQWKRLFKGTFDAESRMTVRHRIQR